MAYEKRPRTGIGSLRKNESDNPNAPLLTGSCKIDGAGEHWIAVFRSKKFPGSYDISFEKKDPKPTEDYQRPTERDATPPDGGSWNPF